MRFALPQRRILVSAALVIPFGLALLSAIPTRAPAAISPPHPALARPTLPYHLTDQFTVGGEGGWGALEFDAATRRLFVSRSTALQVVDPDARKVLRAIPCPDGSHGLVLAPDLRRGFLSSGADTSLLVFDLDSLTIVRSVKLGPIGVGPLIYDAATHRVIVLDPGGTLTAIDGHTFEVVVSHDLGAHPQAVVSDGAGALYVALPELDAIAVLDARSLIERTRWPLDSGARPAALAYDTKNRRLFSAGKGLWLSVIEPDRGRVVSRVPLGCGAETLVFDPERRLLAAIGGGGASSTVWQESADQYSVVSTVGTSSGVRAAALDPQKHQLYAGAAQLARSGRSTTPGARPQMGIVPGSFSIYILTP
jgi:DNA-binding beta-propeller fold protein YncE